MIFFDVKHPSTIPPFAVLENNPTRGINSSKKKTLDPWAWEINLQIQNSSVKTWKQAFPSASLGAGQGLACAVKMMMMLKITVMLMMMIMTASVSLTQPCNSMQLNTIWYNLMQLYANQRNSWVTWEWEGRRGWVTQQTPSCCSSHSATLNPVVSCCLILWCFCKYTFTRLLAGVPSARASWLRPSRA